MPRTFTVVLLFLAVLALTLPGKAVAGPPEGVSGKMVLVCDEVATWCRQFRRERDDETRMRMLKRLKRTDDPRVAVVLGETWEKTGNPLRDEEFSIRESDLLAATLLSHWYIPKGEPLSPWWKENKADLRRRAKHLPQ
jgi:hypothetical protein